MSFLFTKRGLSSTSCHFSNKRYAVVCSMIDQDPSGGVYCRNTPTTALVRAAQERLNVRRSLALAVQGGAESDGCPDHDTEGAATRSTMFDLAVPANSSQPSERPEQHKTGVTRNSSNCPTSADKIRWRFCFGSLATAIVPARAQGQQFRDCCSSFSVLSPARRGARDLFELVRGDQARSSPQRARLATWETRAVTRWASRIPQSHKSVRLDLLRQCRGNRDLPMRPHRRAALSDLRPLAWAIGKTRTSSSRPTGWTTFNVAER